MSRCEFIRIYPFFKSTRVVYLTESVLCVRIFCRNSGCWSVDQPNSGLTWAGDGSLLQMNGALQLLHNSYTVPSGTSTNLINFLQNLNYVCLLQLKYSNTPPWVVYRPSYYLSLKWKQCFSIMLLTSICWCEDITLLLRLVLLGSYLMEQGDTKVD